jgi:hypothetical protein
MALFFAARRLVFALLTLVLSASGRSAVSVVSTYTENFDALGTALPAGWEVWTASSTTGNGTAFNWSSASAALISNNAVFADATTFRNVPGASQSWSAGLSAGTDRALGWRAGNAGSRDGSITLTWADTVNWSFSALSFDIFTPNSSGLTATFNLEYRIGETGTFSLLSATTYTTQPVPIAPNLLGVTTWSLTGSELGVLNDQSGPVTLRLNNIATTGTNWNSVALDNFSYTATAIPEPATSVVACGLAVIAWVLGRRPRRSEK